MKTAEELENNKTEAVDNCGSFSELADVITVNAPFISYSRLQAVEWNAADLMKRIFIVIDGGEPSNVTRANGLRNKVIELYGQLKA